MPSMDAPSLSNAATTRPGTWSGELRSLFSLGWPLIIAQLAQSALFTTDVVMMGWLGAKYLAAGALATAFFICLQLFGIGLVGAVAPLVAQALGARNFRAVRRIVRQGFWASVVIGTAVAPILWNMEPILLALGQNPELAAMAATYAHGGILVLFPVLMIMVLRAFLSAHGATRAILAITVLGVLVNIAFNYALMFGNFGMPRLELRGAAIATTLTNLVMLAAMLGYTLSRRRYRRYHLMAHFWRADWPHFFALFRVGTPIGLMLLSEVGLFSAAAMLMGLLGTAEVAAHAIALQCASLSFMVPLGLSQATTVRVGLAHGRGDAVGVARAGWLSLAMTLGFMALTCALFLLLLLPLQLVGVFLDPRDPINADTLALATTYLVVAGLFQLFDGAQVSAAASLRGLSDTTGPMVIALLGYWAVGLPTAWFLGFQLGWRGVGIWTGLATGLAVVAAILTLRFALRDRLGLLRSPLDGKRVTSEA